MKFQNLVIFFQKNNNSHYDIVSYIRELLITFIFLSAIY